MKQLKKGKKKEVKVLVHPFMCKVRDLNERLDKIAKGEK